jgi:AcrR family transcriptional regulator
MSRLEQRTPARVRAGGRSERVRRHVARACLDLLAEDQLDLGPVEVAQRAGVSRATIHRWWPTKEELLREALTLHTSVLDVPDTGTWAGDLRALATELAAFFSDPTEVSLNAIMASGTHPEFTRAVLAHYAPLFDGWRAVVERARSRSEVRADIDADAVLLTLTAPFLVVPLLLRRTPTDDEVAQIVDLVLAATSP